MTYTAQARLRRAPESATSSAHEEATLSISDVEREIGLTRATLRMWERRYGFPVPQRDSSGSRVYSPAQVERLRRIKRLVDNGFRPGRVIQHELDRARASSSSAQPSPAGWSRELRLAARHAAKGGEEQRQ